MIDIDDKYLEGFNFIDLFAGIGGFHLALNSFGAKCVFASEWDKYAAATYQENFDLKPAGDITLINEKEIPKHDILCAGFPCQAFSVSGKQRGFEDTRGTLFFDIARIVKHHRPKVLFLENVKNLLKHDDGKTFSVIQNCLIDLGYTVFCKVLNASHFGLPQNRERIYVVAFENSLNIIHFDFPKPMDLSTSLFDVIEKNTNKAKGIERNDIVIYKDYIPQNTIWGELELLNKPIQIGKVNKGGQGERIYHPLGHAITLSAYGGGVGAKTGLYLIDSVIRKLTPRECARVQGFPDDYKICSLDNQAYKQFGNSVSVNVLQSILFKISTSLNLINK